MPTLTPEAWAQIRYDYEHSSRPVEDICREHGTTANTIRLRARRWGWKMRRTPIPAEGPPPVPAPKASSPVAATPTPTLPSTLIEDGRERPFAPEAAQAVSVVEESVEPQATVIAIPAAAPTPLRLADASRSDPPRALRAGEGEENEPSPHRDDTCPIGQRLEGAVARVMPALETTLAGLAGAMQPRQMEQAARALGALTRTLRELHGLLAQHQPAAPPRDLNELRASLAQKLNAMIAQEREEMPRRYLAGWEEFAAEAQNGAGCGAEGTLADFSAARPGAALDADDGGMPPPSQPRLRAL